jgi:hypothetical protein
MNRWQDPTDRSFWESKRETKQTLVATDALPKLVNEIEPKATLRYLKHTSVLKSTGHR